MAIYYRKMTTSADEPAAPALGDFWNKVLANGYQQYVWLKQWIPTMAGGNVIAESNADIHYITVVIQEAEPDGQIGWLWIKESLLQAYLNVFNWIPFAGA